MNLEDRVADDQTAQDLIDQAAANGLTKTELLVAIQALYGDAEEAVDWPELNPFGRGDEGEPTLYYLLNDKQKELYGRITIELEDCNLPLDQLKEVYAALIQDPEVIAFN